MFAKKETPVKADKQKRTVQPRQSQVSRQTYIAQKIEPLSQDQPAAGEDQNVQVPVGILGSRAELVKEEAAPTIEEKAGEAEEKDSMQDETVQIPEKFKGKTLQDVIKSYQELESLMSKQAQKKKAEENNQPAIQEVKLPDDIEDKLFENPKEAIADMVKSITSQVLGAVSKSRQSSTDEEVVEDKNVDAEKAYEYVRNQFPEGLSATDVRMIDTLAVSYPVGSYQSRYKNAVADYQKMISDVRGHSKKAADEAEDMKEKTLLPDGTVKKASVSQRKVWKRSDINYLITREPDTYRARQQEILLAIREHRVMENA